jgi:hypothetical protein
VQPCSFIRDSNNCGQRKVRRAANTQLDIDFLCTTNSMGGPTQKRRTLVGLLKT